MTERKYRKVVNTNGWMRKLHVFSFGKSAPRFVGYCPFFWFTWMCILLMPVILPVKLAIGLFRGIGAVFIAALKLMPERGPQRPSDGHLIQFYEDFLAVDLDYAIECWSDIGTASDNLIAWVRATPDWENCAERLIVKRDAAKVRGESREKKVRALSNYGAPIAKTILVIIGVAATAWLLYWMQKLIIKIRWYAVLDALIGVPFSHVFGVALSAPRRSLSG